MNADPLTYAPFLLLLLLGALVEIRYWIRNRARMTPKARLRRGLFLAAVPVLCAALWLGWERAAFWLEEHSAPPYAQIEVPVSDLKDNEDGLLPCHLRYSAEYEKCLLIWEPKPMK